METGKNSKARNIHKHRTGTYTWSNFIWLDLIVTFTAKFDNIAISFNSNKTKISYKTLTTFLEIITDFN